MKNSIILYIIATGLDDKFSILAKSTLISCLDIILLRSHAMVWGAIIFFLIIIRQGTGDENRVGSEEIN